MEVVVDGKRLNIKAGLAEQLPVDLLLGTDVPELMKLVRTPEDYLVLTRSQTRRQ